MRQQHALSLFPPSAAAGRLDFGTDDAIEHRTAVEILHRHTAIYTRSHLVDQLLSQAGWPARDKLLCDPSAGDGAFLAAALHRLLELCPQIDAQGLMRALEGWEIHPGACQDARRRLALHLQDHGWSAAAAGAAANQIVHQGDFLVDVPRDRRYALLLGNPPYIRFTYVPGILQDAYRDAVPEHARADMLHAFLDRCAELLEEDGVVAMITSDRWLFNDGAARLREVLGRRLRVKSLTRVDGETAFYRPKNRRAGTPPRVHPVAVVLRRADIEPAAPLDGRPIYPGAGSAEPRTTTPTLGDVARIRLSPWLGTPGIFVVSPSVAAGLPQDRLIPVADGRDFPGGVFRGPSAFAIRTDDVQHEDELPGAIVDHLRRELPRMCKRGLRSPFWLPPEGWHGKLDLSQESIVVPRISKGLTATRIPAGILPINHAVSVAQDGTSTLNEILALLNTQHARNWIASRAARLEQGYISVTTKLLRQLPLS